MRTVIFPAVRAAIPLLLLCASVGIGRAHAQDSVRVEEIRPGDPEERPQLVNRSEMTRLIARNYPPLLRDAGISGEVVVRARVLETGRVDSASVEVVEATHQGFGGAAVRVVRRAIFLPARAKGQPVPFTLVLPIAFSVSAPSSGAPASRPPER